MNKTKVLHVANMVGGVEICVRQIINNIDKSKIESLIASQCLKEKEELLSNDKSNSSWIRQVWINDSS